MAITVTIKTFVPCTWCYYQFSSCAPEDEMTAAMVNKCKTFHINENIPKERRELLLGKFKL